MTRTKDLVPGIEVVSPDELRNTKSLLDITINALYRSLPSGERNYGSNNSEIGSFSLKHYHGKNTDIIWTMSNKSRRNYHGSVSREIASLYINNRTYDLVLPSSIPKRLSEDTQRVMELLGFCILL